MKKSIFQQVADFYNQNCKDFSLTREVWWSDLNFIRKYLKNKEKILDFGCGNGRLISFLEKENFRGEYYGADISTNLLSIAKEKNPQKKFFLLREKERLPFADNSFDLVLAIAVFHHLSPEMAREILREFKRILRPGGRLVLTFWHLWRWRYLKFLVSGFSFQKTFLAGDIPFGKDKIQTRWCYWWTLGKMERVIRKENFFVLKKGITFSQKQEKRNYWLVAEKSKEIF